MKGRGLRAAALAVRLIYRLFYCETDVKLSAAQLRLGMGGGGAEGNARQ